MIMLTISPSKCSPTGVINVKASYVLTSCYASVQSVFSPPRHRRDRTLFYYKQLLCILKPGDRSSSHMDIGGSVKISPPPQQLFAVFTALLPRWLAPASRSRSSWKTALSEIFLCSLTKCQDVKCPSALRPSCLSSVYPATSLFFFFFFFITDLLVKTGGMRPEKKTRLPEQNQIVDKETLF